MGLIITLTPRAVADLDEIRNYVLVHNSAAADRIRLYLDQAISALAEFPGIGRPMHIRGVSFLPVPRYPYRIYYMIADRELVVLHLRHEARNVPGREDL